MRTTGSSGTAARSARRESPPAISARSRPCARVQSRLRGTNRVKEQRNDAVQEATFADIEAIYHLVNDYATDGVMLARSRNTLYETLRDMIVAVDEEGRVVGVGGLHIIWDRLAEVRTMRSRQS